MRNDARPGTMYRTISRQIAGTRADGLARAARSTEEEEEPGRARGAACNAGN